MYLILALTLCLACRSVFFDLRAFQLMELKLKYFLLLLLLCFFLFSGVHPSYSLHPTEYDYDAPLSEAGDITEKFDAIRNLIGNVSNYQ